MNPERNPEQLLEEIRRLYRRLRDETADRWDRDLPLEELLFDRWERARELGFGEGTSVYHNSYIMWDVRVGRHTWIGPMVMLDGRGGIEIGDHCSIASGVHIYSHDTMRRALSGGKADPETAPVRIGDCTYIGAKSVILKGVTIGSHSVVGAASLVNRDIPDRTAAWGSPAKIRGRVEIDGDDIRIVKEG